MSLWALLIIFLQPFIDFYYEVFIRKNVKALSLGFMLGVLSMVLINLIFDKIAKNEYLKNQIRKYIKPIVSFLFVIFLIIAVENNLTIYFFLIVILVPSIYKIVKNWEWIKLQSKIMVEYLMKR